MDQTRIRCSSHAAQDKVKPPGILKRYLIDKVIDMVNKSTTQLEKAYPTVFQIYRTFKTGLSSFVRDSREYYQVITGLWSGRSLTELSRRQLEVLRQVPRDFLKVIPVLVLALVPGGSVAIPLAYVFPRSFLSYHFWTDHQRQTFWKHDLKHRLQHLRPILDHMQLLSRHIEDCQLEEKILQITKKVQLSVNPSYTEVLGVKPLFESYPYNLDRISIAYVRHLAKCMNMPLRRSRLKADALLLHYTDLAMLREGINNLSDFELEQYVVLEMLCESEETGGAVFNVLLQKLLL
ncbi:hypothetical protein C0Q70_01222 [Pomacea canaliculata]|uniref:Letm1 RBD domain-containing protein n=1 Tax=Pomacea canaliculata TaxID=400727 RepID=A0A2T7PYU9_POMCA|nr:hypothetical protein C0Q70_01222 [Pomacea canaliculata]